MDGRRAVYWFTKAAAQEHAIAQFNLGMSFRYGHGVPRDDNRARYWYMKAASNGNADAQNNLGVIYRNGDGVPTDELQAYLWFNLSASQGNQTGLENLASLEQRMSSERVAEAQRLTLKFQPRKRLMQ